MGTEFPQPQTLWVAHFPVFSHPVHSWRSLWEGLGDHSSIFLPWCCRVLLPGDPAISLVMVPGQKTGSGVEPWQGIMSCFGGQLPSAPSCLFLLFWVSILGCTLVSCPSIVPPGSPCCIDHCRHSMVASLSVVFIIMSPWLLPFSASPGPLLQFLGRGGVVPFLPYQTLHTLPVLCGDFTLVGSCLAVSCHLFLVFLRLSRL